MAYFGSILWCFCAMDLFRNRKRNGIMEKAGKRILTKLFEKLLLSWHFDDNSLTNGLQTSQPNVLEWETAEIQGSTTRMPGMETDRPCKYTKNCWVFITFTEHGFFSSLKTYQFCISYWLYSKYTFLWLGTLFKISCQFFLDDSWNICSIHSQIGEPGN